MQDKLPINITPTHYDITIKTDLESHAFFGLVVVDLVVVEDTETIVLNASKIEITEVTLSPESLATPSKIDFNQKDERFYVHLSKPLPRGSSLKMRIVYNGMAEDNLAGYYYTSFQNGGKTEYYNLTQFQPTDARCAFPCWDEPLIKATFNMNMVSRENTINISNMPAMTEYPGNEFEEDLRITFFPEGEVDGWKITRFDRTPRMSTYIVAFANGPFEYAESEYISPLSGRTVPLRLYTTTDLVDQAGFCLDVGARAIAEYEKIFDIEYPLPKLDWLAPHDAPGAMENWGLIISAQTVVLLDKNRGTSATKKWIAKVQSHEIAHMWFGNIVTMAWWDELWLNEGFATIMGSLIMYNRLFPEWQAGPDFYVRHADDAFSLDQKPSSHPVHVPTPDVNNVAETFDALSYSKAAAVIRMLASYIGEETFLKGVSVYLKRNLYGNSTAKALWEALREVTNIDIHGFMSTWIQKVGCPVLTITETAEGLYIRQDRLVDSGIAKEEDNQTLWQIPLNILSVTSEGEVKIDGKAILTTKEMSCNIEQASLWKINAGATGFYRVLYPPSHLEKLGKEAARTGSILSVSDRLSLISDAFALASCGLSLTSAALSLLNILRDETNYLVWSTVSSRLTTLTTVWWDKACYKTLVAFRKSLFEPLVDKLGYEYSADEDIGVQQLRTLAIQQAASADSEKATEKLSGWFADFILTKSDAHIPPELLPATFGNGVKNGGRKEWEAVRNLYKVTADPVVQETTRNALCNVRDPQLQEETIKFAFEEGRSQDLLAFFVSLGRNVSAGRKAVELLKVHFDELNDRLGQGLNNAAIVEMVPFLLNSEDDAREYEASFSDKDKNRFRMALPQALDGIRARAGWFNKSQEDVEAWLREWEASRI